MIKRTLADVLPPSALTSASAVNIYDSKCRKLHSGTGETVPAGLFARKCSLIRFDEDGFGCSVWLMDETERDPELCGTLANYS